MKPIVQSYEVKATPAQVFDALTNPETIKQWSGAPAEIDDQVGTEFSLFGGNIVGKNVEVIPNQKLVQDWSEGNWEKPSKVTFTLSETSGGTAVDLVHEGVPEQDIPKISEGWQQFYMGQIQKMFGA